MPHTSCNDMHSREEGKPPLPAAAASRRQRTVQGKKGACQINSSLLPPPHSPRLKMKATTAALLLGALLLLSAAHARKESKWCSEQREQCEAGCPKGNKVDFQCHDTDGAPGAWGWPTQRPAAAAHWQAVRCQPPPTLTPSSPSPPPCRLPRRRLRLRVGRWQGLHEQHKLLFHLLQLWRLLEQQRPHRRCLARQPRPANNSPTAIQQQPDSHLVLRLYSGPACSV